MVVAVGIETEIGRISQLIATTGSLTTPLIRQMAAFGKTVAGVVLGVATLVFLFGLFYRDYETSELLLATIGLAIAAIPEGLPAILSIILAIGVQNMAKRRAIVRTLPSVETLGSVSVICSDKTGTLTKNEMTVKGVVTRHNVFDVTGTGYAPDGHIEHQGSQVSMGSFPVVAELIRTFRICNDSVVGKEEDGQWRVKGDPTEGALLTLYEKASFAMPPEDRLATIPFDSEYKYMATIIPRENDNLIMIKGAPDRLLDMAQEEKADDGQIAPLDRAYWEERISFLATQGQRVIGAALKVAPKNQNTLSHDDLNENVIFLGLAGIMDPPRDEAAAAITSCHQAGITVKMITGDHAETAMAIGSEMGLSRGHGALLGRQIDEMTDEQLEVAAHKYNIFARTSPEHKLKLVKAIQSNGSICAMTGDGVNDAPALKMADVGIAMGIKGTEVTKDSAEIVLADDNFSTIVAAVEEGRRVYDNLKKTILFILPTNGAESFLIIASILFGTMLPLTPVQILWVNMVTSVTISLALAFELAEPDVMNRTPRAPDASILDSYFIWRIIFVSLLIGGMTLVMNVILLAQGYGEDLVRTV
ncbi:MAG: HAD-IC family P-type ATPase, partial [Candidatus Adiutrix sp.]